jgi:hypothetical protein
LVLAGGERGVSGSRWGDGMSQEEVIAVLLAEGRPMTAFEIRDVLSGKLGTIQANIRTAMKNRRVVRVGSVPRRKGESGYPRALYALGDEYDDRVQMADPRE